MSTGFSIDALQSLFNHDSVRSLAKDELDKNKKFVLEQLKTYFENNM